MKPDTWIPKPKLKINNKTLIDHQIDWLRKHGIHRLILATNNKNLTNDPDVYFVEEKKLGTGGAVKKAIEYAKQDTFSTWTTLYSTIQESFMNTLTRAQPSS